MRLMLRFIVLGVFVVVLCLLSIPSAKPLTRVQKIRGKLPHRLVSFGDFFSVNSIYQFTERENAASLHRRENIVPAKVSLPNKANKEQLKAKLDNLIEALPEIKTPEVWTARLCEMLVCDLHHNFASAKKAGVDNKIYVGNKIAGKSADFGEQLRKWTELEKAGSYKENGETLFTVWFGMSDILEFAQLPINDGTAAVTDSIRSLFNGLTYISEHWSSKSRILLPYTIDISLLPTFNKLLDRANDPARATEIQRNAVFLSSIWNQGLEIAGEKWKNGQLLIWDVNDWFTSEVRAGHAWGIYEGVGGYGPGKGLSQAQLGLKGGWTNAKAGWVNVRDPCVERRKGRWSVCEDSDKWLMWDDFRLGARAHKQLAKDAFKLIKDSWINGQNVLHVPSRSDIRTLWSGSRGAPLILP